MLRLAFGFASLLLLACESTVVDGEGGGDTAGSSAKSTGSAGSTDGGSSGGYPLVVQRADDGMWRLTFATKPPLTCSLEDPYNLDPYPGCDRYILTAMIPEALLVTGTGLEDDVDGVVLEFVSVAPKLHPNATSCGVSFAPPPTSAKLELVDVSDTVTLRLTGFGTSGTHYSGSVDSEYTGPLCSPDPGP